MVVETLSEYSTQVRCKAFQVHYMDTRSWKEHEVEVYSDTGSHPRNWAGEEQNDG